MFGIGVLKRGGAAGGNVHGQASTVIVIVNSRLVVAVTVT